MRAFLNSLFVWWKAENNWQLLLAGDVTACVLKSQGRLSGVLDGI